MCSPTRALVRWCPRAGSSYTWCENAHELRLTPWHNDPVTDAGGEAIYLRDEESGEVWPPTSLPAPDDAMSSGIAVPDAPRFRLQRV